jgi:hypothetical protein
MDLVFKLAKILGDHGHCLTLFSTS